MSKSNYSCPETISEAIAELQSKPEAKIICGGTDLLVQVRNRMISPKWFIDVGRLPLKTIQREAAPYGDVISIGSGVTYTQIVNSELLCRHFPALVLSSKLVGGPPTRNRGSLGGNLVNASPAADTIPPLLVYDAIAIIVGEAGKRAVPLNEFYVGYRQTVLATDELLHSIHIPLCDSNTAASFIKHGNRRSLYIAVLNVAARISMSGDLVESARIALGCVGPTVFRATAAEELMVGRPLHDQLIADAADEAKRAATPISDLRASADYRADILATVVRRALTEVKNNLAGD